jgi:membrane-bound metal-dependent hydrolase YbcI (DUF457 family)|tara:strand:- start:1074 stop:1532 length:459 start_codon:yes stop_codon:yes gene_type:complete
MKIGQHVVSTLPLGAVYFLLSKDILATSLAMTCTVIVDCDHFLDYIITQKRLASIKTMMQAFKTFKIVRKNYYFLHSWELILLLAFYICLYPKPLLLACFTGYVFHVLLDQIFNVFFLGKYNLKILFYFIIFRISLNFDVSLLRRRNSFEDS